MVALGPARALESVSPPRNKKRRQKQGDQSNAINAQHRDVAGNAHAVGSVGQRRISLRLNAQIVVTRRDARDDDRITALPFAPRTIAVVTVVIAHFTAEVPGLSSVLIDERIVEINPVVVDGSGSSH